MNQDLENLQDGTLLSNQDLSSGRIIKKVDNHIQKQSINGMSSSGSALQSGGAPTRQSNTYMRRNKLLNKKSNLLMAEQSKAIAARTNVVSQSTHRLLTQGSQGQRGMK